MTHNGKRYVVTYTPEETRKAMVRIRYAWDSAQLAGVPDDTPFTLRMLATFVKPVSGKKPIPLRPDLDNIVKLVLDALQGRCFKNDSYCERIDAQKSYGEHDSLLLEISWK
jgi:Holliday junction resolvase RusA-like endonuclease